MKKKLFSLVLFTFLITGLLSACNSPSNIKGEFNQSSYVVSINDSINFLDALTVEGIEKSKISISASNKDVLEDKGDGLFEAVKSGESYIFAKSNNKLIAKTKVSVKYKFSSPKNIQISDDGIVSWDKSFIVVENQTIYAESYKLTYAKYQSNGKLGEATEEILSSNYFEIGEKGVYKIRVQAEELASKEIDASSIEEKELNFGAVDFVEGVSLVVSEDFGNQFARVKWTSKENVIYDVYLEGFLIIENTTNNYFDFDYSRFNGGKSINVEIVAKDVSGELIDSSSHYTLNKLTTPNVDYAYSNSNGFIKWKGDDNALSYKMKVTDFDGNFEVYDIENQAEINQYLAEYQGGAYNVEVMAVGNCENGFYLNSDKTEVKTFGKLGTPVVSVQFEGSKAIIGFDENAYSKNYRITYADKSTVYNTRLGFSTEINLSSAPTGEFSIQVVALPNADRMSSTGVEEIQFNDVTTARVINSNSWTFDFYILSDIGEITHSLEGNISTLSFDAVENANKYSLYVNGQLFEDAEVSAQGDKINITFANLDQIEPNGDKYTFTVVANKVVDGQEYSTEVETQKTISILPVVTEERKQTNGYFAWRAVEGGHYYYEVYSTDQNYENPSDEAVLTATTEETITAPALEYGYYAIKIWTLSSDTNNYLDADFVDENAFFTQNFAVSKQIEAPQITFSDENDIYKLTIHHVEFGGKYQVYVDGQLDGEIVVDELKEKYEYILGAKFENAKKYTISVIASSGLIHDENLHIGSEARVITVERLKGTQFTMEYPKDVYKRKTNENMVFAEVANSVAVEVLLNGNVVLQDGYVLDLLDYAKFGNEFVLNAKYVAKDHEENVYYLDSISKEIKFKRATAPSMICFENGIIKWTMADEADFDSYEGVVSIINTKTSNTYYSFELAKNKTEYDVQALITLLSRMNPAFASEYRQADKIQVELYAVCNGEVDGIYRLPSANGTTTKGLDKLDVFTLEKPVVMFDTATRILSWTEQAEDSVYDIYVDGQVVVEGHETNLIMLARLGEIDYLTEKSIQVFARNSAYLSSEISDAIKIEEISINNALAISNIDGKNIASFNILSDQAKIENVYINGLIDNVNYTQGASVATFDLANFAGVTSFEIYLKAKNQSEVNFYLDSKPVIFKLENLADKTLEIELFETTAINSPTPVTDDNLQWEDYREDFVGSSVQPIVYIVNVTNGTMTYDLTTDVCQLNLENIEDLINVDLVGEVKITVTAKVAKDYVLTLGENGVFGYYGEITSAEFATSKLESVEVSEINIVEQSLASTQLKQKLLSGIEVVFEDKWAEYDNLIFTLYWGVDNRIFTESNLTKGDMKLEDGKYHLFISVKDYNADVIEETFLLQIRQKIEITVRRNATINATPIMFEVNRLRNIASSTVNDDGILTINDTQTASYLLELKISDKTVYKTILSSELGKIKEIDLMGKDLFGGLSENGSYQISILAFDENEKLLPSASATVVEGNKLAGIQNISVDARGYMTFTLYHNDYYNLIFTVKMVNGDEIRKDFTASKVAGAQAEYTISMRAIFELFEEEMSLVAGEYKFEFTIRDSGSINANWVPFALNYETGDTPVQVRSTELEQDFLLFDMDEASMKTTSFTITVSGFFQSGDSVESGREDIYYYPSNVTGYWVTDSEGNNGHYAKNKGSVAGLVYTQYYVINLRTLLTRIAYGNVEIRIARVGSSADGTKYYQYNSTTFNLYKLNKINDESNSETGIISIDKDILSWTWDAKDYSKNLPSAYYLVIRDVIFGNSIKMLLTSSSIDLKTIEMEAERLYGLSVIAINYNTKIIASNVSQELTTTRFSTPISLDVVDGQIVFNVEEFEESEFMQDIINFFAEESPTVSYHSTVGKKHYVNPFSFATQTLHTTKMCIKFTSVVEGGTTNTSYTMTINATSLFPEIKIPFASNSYRTATNQTGTSGGVDTYANLLAMYKGQVLQESESTIEASNTNLMIEAIMASNFGIGDNLLLIDDLYRSLPEGEYMMSVCQVGALNFVESHYSTATKIYVSAPSQLSLDEEQIDGKMYYTATLAPTMNMVEVESGKYEKQLAQKYKMQLRTTKVNSETGVEETILYDFIIQYNGSDWQLSYKGFDLSEAITSVSWSGLVPKFKINMTILRHCLDELKEAGTIKEKVIEDNKLIEINIFTYSQDDGYVVNGKSAKFAINYLALIPEDISFTNGEFVIKSDLDSSYEVYIRYKHISATEQTMTKNFQSGKVNISFDTRGVYEYVVFSINGTITSYRMNIASDAYEVRGIYKLSAPILTTGNNNINISYLPDDIRYMSTLKFSMGNDISMKEVYAGTDKGYYYNSDISITDANGSAIPYVVGSKDRNGDTIYPSELMAEEFYAYLNGNSGTFKVGEELSPRADVLLVFDGDDHAVMSSSQTNIKAKMLPYLADIKLAGGDYYLDDRIIGINVATDENANDRSGNIVYEIIVDYFNIDNSSSSNELIKLHTETYYSERIQASEITSVAQIVDSSFVNSNYDYFTVSITTLGALHSDSNNRLAKRTLEGTYVLLMNSVYYGPNTEYEDVDDYEEGQPMTHILRSQAITTPLMTRTKAPYLNESSNGVLYGAIHFVIDKSLYYTDSEEETVDENTAKRISIVSEYFDGQENVSLPVTGVASFATSSEGKDKDKVFVTVVPDEGLFANAKGTIKLSIKVYGNGAISSTALTIDNVYKLPKMEEKYYSIQLATENDQTNTYLNFDKYFKSVAIAGDGMCYKISISYSIGAINYQFDMSRTGYVKYELKENGAVVEVEKVDYDNDAQPKRFMLAPEITNISIQVQDNQSSTTTNPKKLIYSDTTVLKLKKTTVAGLRVTWSEDAMRFEWAWSGTNSNSYEYYVEANVGGIIENTVVTNNYYMPQNRGNIANGGFTLRARLLSTESDTMYIFSDLVIYENEVQYELFSGGNGSAGNPYLIANEQDFINIARRNTVDKQFYFKLSNDITLNAENMYVESKPIIEQFYGVLDGNGYKITMTSSAVGSLIEGYSVAFTGMNSIEFTQYSSLFHTIAKEGIVKNINLAYEINYSNLNSSNIFFAPISAYNYGKIDNVWISSFAVSRLAGSGQNNVFVGGIVGINYGTIQNCSNKASFVYNMQQKLSLNFGYAGICLVNGAKSDATGIIAHCFNSGDKQITIAYNSNIVYLTGITLSNAGKISLCGNDGLLKLSASQGVNSFTGYYAGITILSSARSTLEYLYNNGKIENASVYGNFNFGGIAYTLTGGTINTLVETSGVAIVEHCSARPTNIGVNYAISGSGTHQFVSTQVLSAKVIDCGNGFNLTIKEVGEEAFTASID